MVSRVLRAIPGVQEVVIHTGQHYDQNMSALFFEELEIPEPDYNLGIGSGTHGIQTGRMLQAVEEILLHLMPGLMVVYGDTNSTLAGALAAAKLHIPVAHVEAGLRSYNRRMPEEINRVLTDHVSDLLLAPTEAAVQNLKQEGISDDRIFSVGDVMYDAALHYASKAEAKSTILGELGLASKGYILATIHRAENTDDSGRLRTIFDGLAMIAKELPVVIPLHPRTQSALNREGLLSAVSQSVQLIDPVGYLDMVMLEKHSRLIVTDSGGVQKEAFFYSVPCATLRNETEWVELIELGWNQLIPPFSATKILDGLIGMLGQRGSSASPYGNGHAAQKITDIIRSKWLW
jgi:UDP-GlcNAc3NAcA epimerase